MAKAQYRYFGSLAWHSMSGNAILAISNILGSNKKIKLHSLEIKSESIGTTSGYTQFRLSRGTTNDIGTLCQLVPHDSASVLPAGITVSKEGVFIPSAENPFINLTQLQTSSGVVGGLFQKFTPSQSSGVRNDSVYKNKRKGFGTENIIVRPGEAVAIISTASTRNQIFLASYTIIIRGTPNKTWVGTEFVHLNPNSSCLIFTNNTISDIMEIKSVQLTYGGTLDTAYLQVVPIGAIQPQASSDPNKKVSVFKTDSSYPDLDPSKINIYSDVGILPFGVPEQYFSEASRGSPKGYNYLQTKDFNGPQYSVLFPEHSGNANAGGFPDSKFIPISSKNNNLLSKNEPIVIRPGEGLAVVSGAETAITTTAVGTAGWQALNFGIVFSVENEFDPLLTLVGLQTGSDIVLLQPGTPIEIINVDSNASTSYSYLYDFDILPTVDIAVYKAGYIPFFIRNLSLNASGLSIPVSQIADRNYI